MFQNQEGGNTSIYDKMKHCQDHNIASPCCHVGSCENLCQLAICAEEWCNTQPRTCSSCNDVHFRHQVPLRILTERVSCRSQLECSQEFLSWQAMDGLIKLGCEYLSASRTDVKLTGDSLRELFTEKENKITSKPSTPSQILKTAMSMCNRLHEYWQFCGQISASFKVESFTGETVALMDPWTTVININNDSVGQSRLLELLQLLSTRDSNHRISKLYIEAAELDDQIIEQISKGLPGLRRLELEIGSPKGLETIAILTHVNDLVLSTSFDEEETANFPIKNMKTLTHILPYFDHVEPAIIENFIKELLTLPRLDAIELELQQSPTEANIPVVEALSNGKLLRLLGVRFSQSPLINANSLLLKLLEKGLPHLEELGLEENQLSRESVDQICKSTKLKVLTLSENSIGVEGLRLLATFLPQLGNLTLCSDKLGFGGDPMEFLTAWKSIQMLQLDNNGIGPEGAKSLGKLTTLEFLSLEKNPIGDDGMEQLSKLTNLLELELGDNGFENGSVHLSAFSRLKRLFYRSNELTAAGARAIGDLQRLEKLQMDKIFVKSLLPKQSSEGTDHRLSVSRECMLSLLGCPNLRHLEMQNCWLDNEAINVLRRHPRVESIEVHANMIGDEGVIQFSRMSQVSVLDLDENLLSYRAAVLIKLPRLGYLCCQPLNIKIEELRKGKTGIQDMSESDQSDG